MINYNTNIIGIEKWNCTLEKELSIDPYVTGHPATDPRLTYRTIMYLLILKIDKDPQGK